MTNEFTTKAQEAIGSALESARAAGNPGVTPLHLLNALLTQNEGIATALLDAVGADRKTIGARARNALHCQVFKARPPKTLRQTRL